jgi:hypothetical protein
MSAPDNVLSIERLAGAMIELARATPSQRVIVAGSSSADIFVELHRRGYLRATTTKMSRYPCAQYDVALVTSCDHSAKALDATLDWLVHFLNSTGVVVVWVSPHERTSHQQIRFMLERRGFRIECGSRCENGVAIVARRTELIPAAKVA